MVILDSSPIPSSSVKTGSRASAAVLRNSSSSGIQERSQPAVPGDQQSQRYAGHDGDAEPDDRTGEARRQVVLEVPGLEQLAPRGQDLVQRRQEHPGGRAGQVRRARVPRERGTATIAGGLPRARIRRGRRPARTKAGRRRAARRRLPPRDRRARRRALVGRGARAGGCCVKCRAVIRLRSFRDCCRDASSGAVPSGRILRCPASWARRTSSCSRDQTSCRCSTKAGCGADVVLAVAVRDVDVDDLLEPAGPRAEHGHALAQVDGLVDAVGDEDDGLAGGLPDPQEFVLELFAGLGVQGGERFVHQQDVRLVGEAAGDGHALLHAAGQLVRVAVLEARQPHQVEVFAGLRGAFAAAEQARRSPCLRARSRRWPRRSARGRARTAGRPRHGPARAGHLLAVHQDLAGGRAGQASQQVQQGGLAGAAGPHQGQELAARHVQAEVVQGGQGGRPEPRWSLAPLPGRTVNSW